MDKQQSVTKKVKIHVKAYTKAEVKINNIGAQLQDNRIGQKKDECNEEIAEYYTEGLLSLNGDTVEISYKEASELMTDIRSTLRFKKSKPNFVNLVRKGPSPTSLVFTTGLKRCICTYSMGGMSFDLCISTNKIENSFSEKGGRILLDYGIEMYGSSAEHNVYVIEYKEYGELLNDTE